MCCGGFEGSSEGLGFFCKLFGALSVLCWVFGGLWVFLCSGVQVFIYVGFNNRAEVTSRESLIFRN